MNKDEKDEVKGSPLWTEEEEQQQQHNQSQQLSEVHWIIVVQELAYGCVPLP
jgi:hypothetical protein